MPGSEYEGRLAERLAALTASLPEGYGFAKVRYSGFGVRAEVTYGGKGVGEAAIYHKPTKGSFSLVATGIDDDLARGEVMSAWERLAMGGMLDADKPLREGYAAFVDGSYDGRGIGYGIVLIKDGVKLRELSGTVKDAELMGSRQIGGEMAAVLNALTAAVRMGIRELTVYHDYEGLAKWCTGEYKASSGIARYYLRQMGSFAGKVGVSFKKVPAHSGIPWNEDADRLAKAAIADAPTFT